MLVKVPMDAYLESHVSESVLSNSYCACPCEGLSVRAGVLFWNLDEKPCSCLPLQIL